MRRISNSNNYLKSLTLFRFVQKHVASNCEECPENRQILDGTSLAQVSHNEFAGGDKAMNARINEATITGYVRNDEQTSEATHQAQYAMLNELPGIVFGFLTLAWIVTSLFGLV
jgi:hypothetical protein